MIRPFLKKCGRVWRIIKKPSLDEWKNVSKISALGIIALGFIGFAISVILKLFV